MSFNRGRSSLAVASAGAVLVLVGGCSSATDNTEARSGASRDSSRTPSSTVQPLSAAELTAALPRDGSLPGYSVTGTPESSTGSSTSDPTVKPEACRPLWDARVQWDPERDLHLQALPYRSLQLGLSGEAVGHYADDWTVRITDVTPLAREIHTLVRSGDLDSAARLLPPERPYPAAGELPAHLYP